MATSKKAQLDKGKVIELLTEKMRELEMFRTMQNERSSTTTIASKADQISEFIKDAKRRFSDFIAEMEAERAGVSTALTHHFQISFSELRPAPPLPPIGKGNYVEDNSYKRLEKLVRAISLLTEDSSIPATNSTLFNDLWYYL